ncbi:MAG: fimbrial protein [Proteus sp. (in: enterobacteria)]|nr:fimbrial protein [Proteus sp. (in: enterobacteria)]
MLIFRGVILFLCMSFLAPSAWAVSGFLKVTVSGSVESRPCKINDGKPIEVNFNDVMTTRIENDNYKQKMDYTLNCKTTGDPSMSLKFTGDGAGFDTRYLQTSVTDLGVLFKTTDTNIYMKTPFQFNYQTRPELYAVLVKKSGATLPTGSFTATATMQVYYN